MRSPLHRALALGAPAFLALVLLVRDSAAGSLITVAATGSADFGSVAAAVAAASDGDVIVVASAPAEEVVVDGKSVTIVATAVPHVRLKRLTIRNLAANQTVVLRGLEVSLAGPPAALGGPVVVADCEGSVRFEECRLRAGVSSFPEIANAVAATSCASLVFRACEIDGGTGKAAPGDIQQAPQPGGAALFAVDCALAISSCTLRGGRGGSVIDPDDENQSPGGAGAAALSLVQCEAFVGDSTLQGGDGGTGGCDFTVCCGFLYGSGGDAGCAVLNPDSEVTVVDSTLDPGTPGVNGCGGGHPGDSARAAQSPVVALAGTARQFHSSRVGTSGTSIQLVFTGSPGDSPVAFGSLAPYHRIAPAALGGLWIAPPPVVGPIALPVVGASGTPVVAAFVVPDLGAADSALALHFQAFAATASGGFVASPPSIPALIDP